MRKCAAIAALVAAITVTVVVAAEPPNAPELKERPPGTGGADERPADKDGGNRNKIDKRRYFVKIQMQIATSSGLSANILKGLFWLVKHQDDRGHWDQDGYQKKHDPATGGKRVRCICIKAVDQYDVAVTGLALLAFLRSGSTHKSGLFQPTVKRALDWLVRQQQKDGLIGKKRIVESWIYNHAIATEALCEAYRITKDEKLETPAKKAVTFIRVAQVPGFGWRYDRRTGRSDTSVTGWMVKALKAAKGAGLKVPDSAFHGAVNWLNRATNKAGKCGYIRPGDPGSVISGVNDQYVKLPTMTAVSVLCRLLCGQKKSEPKIAKGVAILMSNLPAWNKPKNDKVDMHYWYHGTHALYELGGTSFKKWNPLVKKALVENQCSGGCPDGSWDPVGKWAVVAGRVYSTSICLLSLQFVNAPKPKGETDEDGDSAAVIAVLKNGRKLTGVIVKEDKKSITITLESGIQTTIKKTDISQIKRGN